MNVDEDTVDTTNFDYRDVSSSGATVNDITCDGKVVTLYFDNTAKVGATDAVKILNAVEADGMTGNDIGNTYGGGAGYRVDRDNSDDGFKGYTFS